MNKNLILLTTIIALLFFSSIPVSSYYVQGNTRSWQPKNLVTGRVSEENPPSDGFKEIFYACLGDPDGRRVEDRNCKSHDEWRTYVQEACAGRCDGDWCVEKWDKLNPCTQRALQKKVVQEQPREEEPQEIVSEVVTCVFNGANGGEICTSDKGPNCSGTRSCTATVSGGGPRTDGTYEKIKWESSCGSTAYTILDGLDERAVFDCGKKEQMATTQSGCNGCRNNDNCLPLGTRILKDNTPVYCDTNWQFSIQKDKEGDCQNNYECSSNQCSDGYCVDLMGEIKETQGMLQRLLSWFNRLFK